MSNCVKHPDVAATAFCRTCGKAVCSTCARDVRGVVFCEECLAERVGEAIPNTPPPVTPVTPVATGSGSPGLAAVLGFIPGVGAMYNGQLLKGIVHVIIFATLVWLGNNASDFFGIFVAAWVFYMVFDAYQTAKAIKFGLPLPDPLGINAAIGQREGTFQSRMATAGEHIGETFTNVGNQAASAYQTRYGQPAQAVAQPGYVEPVAPPAQGIPTGAVVLILLGILFLLGNLGWLHGMHHWWPIFLIGLGVWMFVKRQQRVC